MLDSGGANVWTSGMMERKRYSVEGKGQRCGWRWTEMLRGSLVMDLRAVEGTYYSGFMVAGSVVCILFRLRLCRRWQGRWFSQIVVVVLVVAYVAVRDEVIMG